MTTNLDFVQDLLNGRSIVPEAVDENRFLQFATSSYLAPLFHESLKEKLPETSEVLGTLDNTRNQVLVRNMRLYEAFNWFLAEMNERGIPIIPLKGIYAAEKLYGDVSLRHLSDIDVLIKWENVSEVVELMEQNAWGIKAAKSHSDLVDRELEVAHPYTFFKNGVTIELHTHLYDLKHGAEINEEALWSHAREETFIKGGIHQFEMEFLLQHWCLHLHKHLIGHEVKMLSFWDIKLLLKETKSFDWHRFERLCKQYSCTKETFGVLFLCSKYWGVQVPDKCKLPDSTLELKFLQFLESKPKTATKMAEHRLSANLRRVGKLESPQQKMIFLIRYVFPQREFMHQCYGVRSDRSILLWYFYRPIELATKLVLALGGKLVR